MPGHWHYIVWGFVGLVLVALDLLLRWQRGQDILAGFNWVYDLILFAASMWSFAIGFRKWNRRQAATEPS